MVIEAERETLPPKMLTQQFTFAGRDSTAHNVEVTPPKLLLSLGLPSLTRKHCPPGLAAGPV
jgi:hypothetical protein